MGEWMVLCSSTKAEMAACLCKISDMNSMAVYRRTDSDRSIGESRTILMHAVQYPYHSCHSKVSKEQFKNITIEHDPGITQSSNVSAVIDHF